MNIGYIKNVPERSTLIAKGKVISAGKTIKLCFMEYIAFLSLIYRSKDRP
ncbi:MAG: hypothetical protein PHH37_15885 [Paludibacter sp.]|nr:hypothetical protein [Paludibacter sp.]